MSSPLTTLWPPSGSDLQWRIVQPNPVPVRRDGNGGTTIPACVGTGAKGRCGSPEAFQPLARQLTPSAWSGQGARDRLERAARLLHGRCATPIRDDHPRTSTMSTPTGGVNPSPGRRFGAARVIIVSTVALTFISYWRTAAVVLCDLASTVYYIGGIVENAIGPAAPWFILAVMLFSYTVRSVYIESCSLFVRGGVYRVVKEAMGGILAKFSVSALMFDYILTGPTSGVSAGQYIMGLAIQSLRLFAPELYASLNISDDAEKQIKA